MPVKFIDPGNGQVTHKLRINTHQGCAQETESSQLQLPPPPPRWEIFSVDWSVRDFLVSGHSKGKTHLKREWHCAASFCQRLQKQGKRRQCAENQHSCLSASSPCNVTSCLRLLCLPCCYGQRPLTLVAEISPSSFKVLVVS